MPIYKYQCVKCHKVLEVIQKITDEPLQTCNDCGGTLKKMIGRVGIKFTGSGFYITDKKGSKTLPSTTNKTGEQTGGKAEPAESRSNDGKSQESQESTPSGQSDKKEAV